MKPYTEESYAKHGTRESYTVRTFEEECNDLWFKEKDTQRVRVFRGDGWELQIGEDRPIIMEIGKQYSIPRNRFYRVLKGEGNLVVRLEII